MNNKVLTPPTPNFYVFRQDGSKKPNLRRFFLDRRNVTAIEAAEGRIILNDKTEWKLILEEPVLEALKKEHHSFCIVSFQAYNYGNFAVARLVKDKDNG